MNDNKLSAYHEGAHATLSYLWGSFPERTSIRAQGNSPGHVQYLRAESESIARAAVVGTRDIDRYLVMRNLVATAAGPVAQSMVMGGVRSYPFAWTTYDGMHDHGVATRLMTAAGDLLHTSLDDLVEEAADLLEVPRIWGAVEAVARELLRYRELDYKHLQLVVLGAVDEVAPPRPKPGRARKRAVGEQRSALTAPAQLAGVDQEIAEVKAQLDQPGDDPALWPLRRKLVALNNKRQDLLARLQGARS